MKFLSLVMFFVLVSGTTATALESFGNTITPDTLFLGNIPQDSPGARSISITNTHGGLLSGSSMTNEYDFSAFGNITLGSKGTRISKGETYQLSVRSPAGLPAGNFSASVKIFGYQRQAGSTLAQKVEIATIPVTANILPIVQILTKSVAFGNVPFHTSQTKFADIRFNSDAILQFTSNSPLFQFSTNPLSGSGGQTRNVGIIITKDAPVGNHTAKIAVAKKLLQTTTPLPIGFIDVTATVVVSQTDLTVTIQPSPNVISGNPSEIEFVFRVFNSGDLSKACEMQIELDGTVEKTVSIPAIPANAGGSATEIFLPVNQPGQHQVKLRVDSNNVNQESNETNNEVVFSINVP